jgi:hypothetical protein
MTPALRAAVLDRDHHRCRHCGGTALHVDHRWPRALGGTDDPMNLQALCAPCNRRKGSEPPAGMLPLFTRACETHLTRDDRPLFDASNRAGVRRTSPHERASIALLRERLDARVLTERERSELRLAEWNAAVS